jgi:hypothetical protein
MHATTLFSILPLLALSSGAPASDTKRAVSSTCPSYTIINTRGTGEPQGESSGFRTMNSRARSALTGGKIYSTVYAADYSQNSALGTRDIVNKITSTLRTSPNECFILEGYSQGAQATVNALSQLTGASFDAVKGVFLIGDPAHKSGLACNVDNNGGTTTRDVDGLSGRYAAGIPSNWIAKTLDVCIFVSCCAVLWGCRNGLLTVMYRVMVFVILRTARVSMRSTCSTRATLLHRTWARRSSLSSWELKRKISTGCVWWDACLAPLSGAGSGGAEFASAVSFDYRSSISSSLFTPQPTICHVLRSIFTTE